MSVFGKIAGTDEYVLLRGRARSTRSYELRARTWCTARSTCREFDLHDYPITEADILVARATRPGTRRSTPSTSASTTSAGRRSASAPTPSTRRSPRRATAELYGMPGHRLPPRQAAVHRRLRAPGGHEAGRAARRRLHALGVADDRRYLLYNPVVKMKVTTEGEDVINHLWDVIAAKGFEKDMYFEMAARDIRGLPKLEGTVHVNIALIVKFMPNYFFDPAEYPPSRGATTPPTTTSCSTRARPGAGQDPVPRLGAGLRAASTCPTCGCSASRSRCSARCSATRRPTRRSARDIDFLLALGELFTLRRLRPADAGERRASTSIDDDVVDQIFDVSGARLLALRRAAARQAQHAPQAQQDLLPAP